mgnify:CR=1 FL=1
MPRIDLKAGEQKKHIARALKEIRAGYVIVAPLEHGYVYLADAFSPLYRVHSKFTPLHKFINLKIKSIDLPKELESKALIALFDIKTGKYAEVLIISSALKGVSGNNEAVLISKMNLSSLVIFFFLIHSSR